jgi:hypothetical protein
MLHKIAAGNHRSMGGRANTRRYFGHTPKQVSSKVPEKNPTT